MAKKNTDFSTASFNYMGKALKEILDDFTQETYEQKEKGLDEASDFMKNKLAQATPINSGETAREWERSTKYKNVRYINNGAVNKKGIPIVNFLEYSTHKGHPFVRRTFDQNVEQAAKIIAEKLSKGE